MQSAWSIRFVIMQSVLLLTACANSYPAYMTEAMKHPPVQYSLPASESTPLAVWMKKSQKIFYARAHVQGTIATSPPLTTAHEPTMKDTHLLKKLLADTPMVARVQDSAIYPLANGVEAFAARNALIKNARVSLDLQYYTLQKGLSTRLLIREIVAAADRGVRVRILLDDRAHLGRDKEMLMLNAHPNIEVRVFNPIKRFRSNVVTRWAVFLSNLSELRRRMHIKMWLADGVLGITGGRNLGDRYFNAGEEDNFADMDVLLGGSVVKQMQAGFDAYWNAEQVLSVDAFDAHHEQMRRAQISSMIVSTNRLTRKERVQRHPYLQALEQTEHAMLDQVLNKTRWGQVEFLMDPPEKIVRKPQYLSIHMPNPDEIRVDTPVFDRLIQVMSQAKKEVLVVSPYFLPGKPLTDFLIQLKQRGVRVTLLTNSLESNDVPAVNGHYDKYRERLLSAGIQMHELRGFPETPPQPEWRLPIFTFRGSRAALHSKVVIVDGQTSFVGSMNLDHASVVGNTEVGVIVHEAEVSVQLRQLFLAQLEPKYSYELRQNARQQTTWRLNPDPVTDEAGAMQKEAQVLKREPGNLWRRVQKYLGSLFPEYWM